MRGSQPRPGTADIQMTERLHNALNMCELDLVDHVVISAGSFYSFADEQVTPGSAYRLYSFLYGSSTTQLASHTAQAPKYPTTGSDELTFVLRLVGWSVRMGMVPVMKWK